MHDRMNTFWIWTAWNYFRCAHMPSAKFNLFIIHPLKVWAWMTRRSNYRLGFEKQDTPGIDRQQRRQYNILHTFFDVYIEIHEAVTQGPRCARTSMYHPECRRKKVDTGRSNDSLGTIMPTYPHSTVNHCSFRYIKRHGSVTEAVYDIIYCALIACSPAHAMPVIRMTPKEKTPSIIGHQRWKTVTI